MVNLTLDDLMTGLFATLAQKGITSISTEDNRIDQALGATFPSVQRLGEQENLKICFRIIPHSIHGDSGAVQNALFRAQQRGVLSYSSICWNIEISKDNASLYLEHVSGSQSFYEALAREFLYQLTKGL